MALKTVTSSEFRQKAGQYIDDAGRAPIIITRHNRPARVLIDIEFYERLAALEKQSQEFFRSEALTEDQINLIRNAQPGAGSIAAQKRLGEDETGLTP